MPPKNKERFEILLEDMTDRIRLLAEGQTMQGDRLETKMEEGFKEQNRQRELDNRAITKWIDDGLAGVNNRIDRVEASLTKGIQELKTDIREKVLPRLEDHEQRLTALEEKPAA